MVWAGLALTAVGLVTVFLATRRLAARRDDVASDENARVMRWDGAPPDRISRTVAWIGMLLAIAGLVLTAIGAVAAI